MEVINARRKHSIACDIWCSPPAGCSCGGGAWYWYETTQHGRVLLVEADEGYVDIECPADVDQFLAYAISGGGMRGGSTTQRVLLEPECFKRVVSCFDAMDQKRPCRAGRYFGAELRNCEFPHGHAGVCSWHGEAMTDEHLGLEAARRGYNLFAGSVRCLASSGGGKTREMTQELLGRLTDDQVRAECERRRILLERNPIAWADMVQERAYLTARLADANHAGEDLRNAIAPYLGPDEGAFVISTWVGERLKELAERSWRWLGSRK